MIDILGIKTKNSLNASLKAAEKKVVIGINFVLEWLQNDVGPREKKKKKNYYQKLV